MHKSVGINKHTLVNLVMGMLMKIFPDYNSCIIDQNINFANLGSDLLCIDLYFIQIKNIYFVYKNFATKCAEIIFRLG